MSRHTPALPVLGRVVLASVLCMLAFAFAMEAKMAWYGPVLGPTRDLSAAKAMPADTPVIAGQRIHHAHPIPLKPAILWLQAFAALLLFTTSLPLTRFAPHSVRVIFRPHFSSLLFFRPPPAYC